MNKILKKFPKEKTPEEIVKASGVYYYLKNGTKLMDATSGWTGYANLGFSHPRLINAIEKQLKKFSHIDYNIWHNPQLDELAEKILNFATNGLDKIYFGGTSGSDAIDAAMKLSYQIHHDNNKKEKINYISRVQSFNGATLQAMSVSDLPILKIYDPLMPKNVFKISQHNPYTSCEFDIKKNSCICGKNYNQCIGKLKNETDEEYVKRGAQELEEKILEIGPEKVCAFIGETQLGSLVGDVPPVKGYWQEIGKICEKYDVHLILDEVYSGFGRSGKFFNYSWDNFSPDFVCIGKNTTSGVAPLSAIVTKSKFEDIIANGSGRIQLGHTFQGFSLGVAACLESINIMEEEDLLNRINEKGAYSRKYLEENLNQNEFFKNVRGRGFGFSLEHKTPNNVIFALEMQKRMKLKHNILINSKWHRTSFVLPFILSDDEIDNLLEKFVQTFNEINQDWLKVEQSFDLSSISPSMSGVNKNNK